MDNDLILRQFDEIERQIEHLLKHVKSLEALNIESQNKISQLEEALQIKVEVEKRNAEEKAFVRSRIDGLVAKLKDITEI